MKKKIVLAVIIICLLIATLNVTAASSLPTDANPLISVNIDNSSTTVLRYTSSVRNECKGSSHLRFFSFDKLTQQEKAIFESAPGEYFAYVCSDINLKWGSSYSYWVENTGAGERDVLNCHLQPEIVYSSSAEAQTEVNRIKTLGLYAFPAYIDGIYKVRIGNFATVEDAAAHAKEYTDLLSYNTYEYYVKTAQSLQKVTGTSNVKINTASGVVDYENFPAGITVMGADSSEIMAGIAASTALSPVGDDGRCLSVVNALNGNILLEFSDTNMLSVRTSDNGPIYHRHNDSLVSEYKNIGQLYAGSFNFQRDAGDSLKRVKLVNYVYMQDYLKMVVPREIGHRQLEALKAQAISARSYAYIKMNGDEHGDTMLCSTTHCQVYGLDNSSYIINSDGSYNMNNMADVFKAVDETYGVVGVSDGKIAVLYYYASNGGYTINSGDAWYYWSDSILKFLHGTNRSYLTPVVDPFDSFDTSTKVYSKSELYQLLWRSGNNNPYINQYPSQIAAMGINEIDEIRVTKYSNSVPVEVEFIKGDKKITTGGGDNIRILLKLRSPYFLTENGSLKPDANGNFNIVCKGYGHNVGMSQEGAINRAKAGHTYDNILKAYYPGLQLYTIK